MRAWQVAVLAVVVAAGCSKRKLHWSGKRAPQIEVGGWIVPIPADWRDAGEADDDDMRKLLASQHGARAVVREDFDGAAIVINSGANEATPASCEAFAQALAKSDGAKATDIETLKVDGDLGCAFRYAQGDTVAEYWVRFHDTNVIAISCFDQGNAETVALCKTMRGDTHFAK
jgi:hypothetical protein